MRKENIRAFHRVPGQESAFHPLLGFKRRPRGRVAMQAMHAACTDNTAKHKQTPRTHTHTHCYMTAADVASLVALSSEPCPQSVMAVGAVGRPGRRPQLPGAPQMPVPGMPSPRFRVRRELLRRLGTNPLLRVVLLRTLRPTRNGRLPTALRGLLGQWTHVLV